MPAEVKVHRTEGVPDNASLSQSYEDVVLIENHSADSGDERILIAESRPLLDVEIGFRGSASSVIAEI